MTESLLGIALLTALLMLLSLAVLAARSRLLPSGPVTVTVNGSRALPAQGGTTLLRVLLDAGIPLPAACGGKGTCGLCRVVVTGTAGSPMPAEAARLSRRDMQGGWRLACQVSLRNNLSVKVSEAFFGVNRWTCTLRSARSLSPQIKEIVLALPPGERLAARAGAFIQVTAPAFELPFTDIEIAPAHAETWDRLGLRQLHAGSREPVTRAYSIANTPDQTDAITLLVRLALPPPAKAEVPPGIVSSYLFGLRPGSPVAVEGPYGDFAARDTDREMVFIGGGVGMAPLRAIIFDQLERVQTNRRMSFWYGARSRVDLFYGDEFDALKARHQNFDWTVALSDPQPTDAWTGATGFIHDVVLERYLRRHPSPEDCEYYLCGPPLMIKAVLAMLDQLGVDPGDILFDDFGS